MQFLKKAALILAVAAISIGAQSSFAQQEIDPDHYDQPIAAKAPAHKSPLGQKQAKANVASRKAKRHPARRNA